MTMEAKWVRNVFTGYLPEIWNKFAERDQSGCWAFIVKLLSTNGQKLSKIEKIVPRI